MMTVGELGEAALVRAILERISDASGDILVPAGDDGAVVVTGPATVVTLDTITAGLDYLPTHTPPMAIGHRVVAVNLSDLAAMGATPTWLVFGAEFDSAMDAEAAMAVVDGAVALARRFGAIIVGGDVGIRPGPTALTVCALGAPGAKTLRRSNARPGDDVWLIGELGLASIGLAILRSNTPTEPWHAYAVSKHLWPEPQVWAGKALAALDARIAAIDVSDGLGIDAARLAAASRVRLNLDLGRLPWGNAMPPGGLEGSEFDWRSAIAAGGDDYALLVTAPAHLDLAVVLAGSADSADLAAKDHVWRIGHVAALPAESHGADAIDDLVCCSLLGEDISALLGGFLHGSEPRHDGNSAGGLS